MWEGKFFQEVLINPKRARMLEKRILLAKFKWRTFRFKNSKKAASAE